MKVLVIPDVHLKPQIFHSAAIHLRNRKADTAVVLGDLLDDWGKQFLLEAYKETLDAAAEFTREFPDTRWCYGNHDYSYEYALPETGYSKFLSPQIRYLLHQFQDQLPEDRPMKIVHRIDNVLFCHGGISESFAKTFLSDRALEDVDLAVEEINQLTDMELWARFGDYDTPIWYRPELCGEMYASDHILQVVGHTPVEEITRIKNMIMTDVFSTDRQRRPIGSEEFIILDTETWEYEKVK